LELLIEYKNRGEREENKFDREREKRKGEEGGSKKPGEGRWGRDK